MPPDSRHLGPVRRTEVKAGLGSVLVAGLWVLSAGACRGDDDGPGREDGSATPAVSAKPTKAPTLAPTARVDSERAWLDLIAQRPLALDFRDGVLVADLGRPQGRLHVALAPSSPWRVGEEVEGRRAAVLVGRTGSFDLPLDGPLSPALNPPSEEGTPGLAIAVTMRSFAPKQRVTVLWDETPLTNLTLGDGWERRTVSIPTELAHTGENRLRLHFGKLESLPDGARAPAAVSRIEVGPLEAIRKGAPAADGYQVLEGGEALQLEAGAGLAWYFVPPPRARLRVEVRGRGGVELRASTDIDHAQGKEPARLHQEALRETGSSFEVDLAGYGGVPTRLQLDVRGSDAQASARFDRIEVQVERSRPVDRRDRKIRDVFVFAVEGARPDDWFSGASGSESIDAFVRDSLVFERAYALGAAAVPSHAGWLSSVVPPTHLTVRGTFVAERQTLISELFERAGFFNAVFTSNTDVEPERGLTQGFAAVRSFSSSAARERNAHAVVGAMLEDLERRPTPRFFYSVMNDPQAPYDPPREVVSDVEVPERAPAPHLTHMWVGRVRLGKVVPDEAQLQYVRELYRGELRVVDAAIGKFLKQLRSDGNYDDAIVVLMGIHGEEFREHEGAGHGRTLFEESIRVPVAIRAPALLAPGRVEAPVDLLDLAPTLADLSGLAPADEWQGRSWVPLIDDPQPEPQLVVSYLGDGSRAAIIGDHKFVLHPGVTVEAQQLFDLGADPKEQIDLRQSGRGGVQLRMLINAMTWHLRFEDRWRRDRWGTGAALTRAFGVDNGL